MKKIHIKLMVMQIAIVLIVTCLHQEVIEAYAGSQGRYLVLIQQEDGSWKEYHNLLEQSRDGNIMVKAKQLSKALGFTYKNNGNGTFAIKRSSSRFNIYKINLKEYTYTNGANKKVIAASNSAYVSKSNDCNVCQAFTLSTLISMKYFNTTATKEYEGYSGVICYSSDQEVPVLVPIATSDSEKKPTPTPKPEPKIINVRGVEFPVRSSFLPVKKALSDWDGRSTLWNELELALDGKVLSTTELFVSSDTIQYFCLGTSTDSVHLSKTKSGYKISINVQLDQSAIAETNADILKAMIATISSKPSLVYSTIYESFTTENTHGFNDATYVTVGDCKVKVKIKDGEVIYYIK